MILSNGVLVKSPNVVWAGSPQSWGSWPSSLQIGFQWVSYAAMYRKQDWVRICVDKRADLLARLPLKVYRHDDLNRPEEPEHPYAQLLARPNTRHSRFVFWRWVQATYDIYGEAFVGKQRDQGGRPYQLVPLHPTSMREVEDRDGRTIWDFDNGHVQISGIPDEDLIHPRTYNPDSFTRGLSKLESLRSTLENEDYALRAQSSFWKRGARPGVALTHPGTLSQPAADRLKIRWDAIAAGADNTGTTVVLEEGMKPEILTLNAEEAQYIDARKLNREEVVAGYDMPPPAVHILDHATYSNITAQLRSVYRDTMAPVTIFHEGELETQLRGAVRPNASAPDFSDEVYAEFLLDGVLRGDFEERANAYQAAINSGWTTPAEVRKLENLPFMEGSDRLFINSTMVPLEAAAAAAAVEEETPDNVVALPLEAVRTVMGRLSRQKSLDEVDGDALIAGLNGGASLVLAEFDAAKTAGLDVEGFRTWLGVVLRQPDMDPATRLTAIRGLAPRRLAVIRDKLGRATGIEENNAG
jgi:HK97 family phage portal protein